LRRVWSCWLGPVVAVCALQAGAQEYARVEAGVGVASQTFVDGTGKRLVLAGPSGVVSYNLSPSLAIEGSLGYLPEFAKSPVQDSGRELLGFGGVKMGRRGRRLGVYGKIEPGLVSFSCGYSVYGPAPGYDRYTECERRTDFALQYGGVAEYVLGERTAVRVDAGQTLVTEFDQVVARSSNATGSVSLEEIVSGHVAQHFDLRLSLEHRFGGLREGEAEREGDAGHGRVDVGVLYSLQPKTHLLESSLEPDSGGGLWVSWNLERYVSWDTSAIYFPHDDHTADFQDGGSSFDGFSGIKVGIRGERVGLFAKVRPGAIVFTRTEDSLFLTRESFLITDSKFVDFGLDTGGVVEVYPAGRAIVRAEAGELSIFYPAKTTMSQGVAFKTPGLERSAVMLLFGVGYRF
jgi:hypothetical protein